MQTAADLGLLPFTGRMMPIALIAGKIALKHYPAAEDADGEETLDLIGEPVRLVLGRGRPSLRAAR